MPDRAHLLELYVRAPETLEGDARRSIAERIRSDETWKAAFEFLTGVYESMPAVAAESGRVLHLRKHRGQDATPPEGVTLLAAHEPTAQTRYRVVTVLEDRNGSALVRFVWDQEALELRAYVLGALVEQSPALFVPSLRRAFSVDRGGRTEPLIQGGMCPPASSLEESLLGLPVGTAPQGSTEIAIESETGTGLIASVTEGRLTGEFRSEDEKAWFLAVDESSGLTPVSSGPVSLPVKDAADVRLYGF